MYTLKNNKLFEHKWLLLILLIYGTIYCSISLVNHYFFRTNAYDLGIYNNVIFDYSKFQINDNPVMSIRYDNILSDHLSLYHLFYGPFRYLLGTWTLLIFQILSFLFGAIGIYTLILKISKEKLIASLASIYFLSMWGIFSALSFDYHDNVVGSMFVPWLILAFENKNKKLILIWSIVIVICKENMSLWLAFIYAGLFLIKFKDKDMRKIAMWGVIASFLYFIVAIKIIIPSLLNEGKVYFHFKYSALGNSPSDYITTILTDPKYVFSLFFENNSGYPIFDGIKTELHFIVLLSGGLALIYRPQYLIMLIPIYLQKMFNDSPGKWGINNHYSIEFAPILTIAFFFWILSLNKSYNFKKWVLLCGTIICIATSMSVIPNRDSKWYNSTNLNFWNKKHYEQKYNVKSVYNNLKLIPSDAKVCAQTMLVPHLAFREDIYTFPYIRNAEYIALIPAATNNTYPLSLANYNKAVENLKKDTAFTTVVNTKEFLLFKRK